MARPKTKVRHIKVSLNEKQSEVFDKMMADDMRDDQSAFIASLISEEAKRREIEENKRKPGRPQGSQNKEDDYVPDDVWLRYPQPNKDLAQWALKAYPYVTEADYIYWCEANLGFVPPVKEEEFAKEPKKK